MSQRKVTPNIELYLMAFGLLGGTVLYFYIGPQEAGWIGRLILIFSLALMVAAFPFIKSIAKSNELLPENERDISGVIAALPRLPFRNKIVVLVSAALFGVLTLCVSFLLGMVLSHLFIRSVFRWLAS